MNIRPLFFLVAFVCQAAWAEPARSPVGASQQVFVDKGELAGAVTVVWQDGKLLNLEAVGKRDLAAGDAMAKDSLFWIASMTKPVTALAVMMLQEEGKLSIEDPVSKYLPEFKGQMLLKEKTAAQTVLVKPSRPITIKDLLTHTSGLVGNSPLDGDAIDVLTLKEAVITYALSPLQFEPGSKWSYCNPGINTLGRLVEVVSGEEYAAFLQKRLFGPLGMKDTTFWPTETQMKRLATSYKPGAGGGLEVAEIKYLTPPFSNSRRTPLAAGGLFSTAEDLLKLYVMLMNGGEAEGRRYVGRETLALMTRNHTGALKAGFTPGMGMGLGFQVVVAPAESPAISMLSAGTYGHGGAHGTQGWMDPVKKSIHILLIQRAGLKNGDASPMRQAFQEAAAGLLK